VPAFDRERSILADLQKRWNAASNAKKPFEKQVKQNIAFLVGLQWLDQNPVDGSLIDTTLNMPSWRIRYTANRIMKAYLGLMGRFLAQPVEPGAVPVGADSDTVRAAQAADRLAKFLWHRDGPDGVRGLEFQMPEFYAWLLTAGTVFIYHWWDPSLIAEGIAGDVEGDIGQSVESPLNIWPDANATSWEQASHVFRQLVRPVDWAKLKWPHLADELKPENIETNPPVPSQSGGAYWQRPQKIDDALTIREYYEKPSSKYPKGRYAITNGKFTVLINYHEELPYEHGEIPLEKVDFIRIPGAFWGMSFIQNMRDPQKALNQLRSKSQEHIRMMSAGKWLIHNTAGVDKITSASGEIVRWGGVHKPEQLTPKPLGTDVERELNRIDNDLQDAAGMYLLPGPGKGITGRVTATQMAMIREAEDLARVPFYQSVKLALESHFRNVITLAQHRYIEPRKVYVGAGPEADIAALEGSDLEGSWKIKIRMDRETPLTRSERLMYAEKFWQMGVFGEPKTPEAARRFLHFLDMDFADAFYAQDDVDVQNAEKENWGFRYGGSDYEVGLLDQHVIHIEHHLQYLKAWNMEPDRDPVRIARLEAHVMEHIRNLAKPGQPEQGA